MPFKLLVTESLAPRESRKPARGQQPSVFSLRSAAATVVPEHPAALGERASPKRSRLWLFALASALTAIVGLGALRGRDPISSTLASGSPGYRQVKGGKHLRWEKKALTIYLDDSLGRLGAGGHEAIIQAFGQWATSDPRLPDLSFDTGSTSSLPKQDGKSTVSYGRITQAGHEHDVAITVTYANDRTGEILEADIVINALYQVGVLSARAAAVTQTAAATQPSALASQSKNRDGRSSEAVDCRNRYDAQNVATHEVGHFFGLGEDVTERSATMFQSINQCELHKRLLGTTDVEALSALYAEGQSQQQSNPNPRACGFGAQPQQRDPTWVSALLLALALRRRRCFG